MKTAMHLSVTVAALAATMIVPARSKQPDETDGPYAHLVLNSEPVAYWRLGESENGKALDRTGGDNHATIEPPVVHSIPGPQRVGLCGPDVVNRCLRFAGGRLVVDLPELGNEYSVEMWFRIELRSNTRPAAGYLFSRGPGDDPAVAGDHVSISGSAEEASGSLGFHNGDRLKTTYHGGPVVEPQTWCYLVFVRRGKQVQVFLNGAAKPVVDGEAEVTYPGKCGRFCFGGRSDNTSNFDGMLDEIAVYDRALSPGEIRMHYRQSDYPHVPSRADFAKMEQVLPETADEIYMFTVFSRERSRVLLSLDMTKEANQVPGRREDNDHAISWIHQYGEGRVFYCSLGNNIAPFHAPQVLQHHLDGIQWILGDLPADATPSAKLPAPPTPALAPNQ